MEAKAKEAARNVIRQIINRVSNDLQQRVQAIEASPMTTENHYGYYLTLLNEMGHGDSYNTRIVAASILEAGANRKGVAAALAVIQGDKTFISTEKQ